jgi:hypothetical protein
MMACDNCGGSFSLNDDDYYLVEHHLREGVDEFTFFLCSPSCLVEWAWKIKESQQKLSKSAQFDIPDPT